MNEILKEIKELKNAISQIIGSSDLPEEQKFSKDALDRAAKEYKQLGIERGEWVVDYHVDKIITKAPYRAAAFIINEFEFKNYFKRGHNFYLNRKDLIALNKELKARNIDLRRYAEFRLDQDKFRKYVSSVKDSNKVKGKKKPSFKVPDIKNFFESPAKLPSVEVIKKDIQRLKEEFNQLNLSDYVDVYNDNHAMLKSIYWFEKYLEPGTKRRCKKWCDDFNYAQNALEKLTAGIYE